MSRAAILRRGMPAAGVAAPADKRFRRPAVRPGRRRRLGVILRRTALVVIALSAAVGAVGWTYSAVVGAHWLAINRVTVGGNARLSTGEVAALIDNMRGKNILLVDQ